MEVGNSILVFRCQSIRGERHSPFFFFEKTLFSIVYHFFKKLKLNISMKIQHKECQIQNKNHNTSNSEK